MSVLPLHTRITFTTPEGVISDTGRELIQRFIQEQTYDMTEWKALNPDTAEYYIQPLPDDWKWVWVVTEKGDYVGTFPKRAGKFYRQAQSLKAPTKFLTNLGNLARSHSVDPVTYDFEFVDSIDWYAGKFGDGGSCYWSDRKIAKKLLTDNGGLAVCFYDNGNSKARAWIVPVEDMFIVFNGYGFSGSPTLLISQIMAQYLGMSYKKIDLSNHGHESGLLYINGGTGYVIGSSDSIKEIASHDFEFDGDYTSCARCGDYVDDDECYYTPSDEIYCQDCFDEQCSYCAHCDDTHWTHDMTEVNYETYCNRCLYKKFTVCDGCHDHFENDDVTNIGDENFCETCRDENFELCSECSEWKDKETFVNKDDENHLCQECAENIEEE